MDNLSQFFSFFGDTRLESNKHFVAVFLRPSVVNLKRKTKVMFRLWIFPYGWSYDGLFHMQQRSLPISVSYLGTDYPHLMELIRVPFTDVETALPK